MNEAKAQVTVADRSQEFVPVEGSQETSSAGGLLVAAYALMWVLVFAFIWLTSKRLKSMSGRIDELESALLQADRRQADGAAGESAMSQAASPQIP